MKKLKPKQGRPGPKAQNYRLRALKSLCRTNQMELYDVYCFLKGIQVAFKIANVNDEDMAGTVSIMARMARDAITTLRRVEQATDDLSCWE